jgi:3'-phosphoadenosine 5'-phosphosulfate sulfotransferase (PAPS reductase)/FAD synthetase
MNSEQALNKVVVCFSGGKDSTAMLLRMIELGEKIDYIIFADTDFEYPELYEYVNKIEKIIGRKIIRVKSKKSFEEWMFGKLVDGKNKGKVRGFPFILSPCFWHREAKKNAVNNFLKGIPHIRCIGIASDEKKRIQKDKTLRYPLIEWGWTEQDCIDYLEQKGLANSLYKRFRRIGCFCCPKQNENSKYKTWLYYPELWEKIEWFEKENLRICGRNIFAKPIEVYVTQFKNKAKEKEIKEARK